MGVHGPGMRPLAHALWLVLALATCSAGNARAQASAHHPVPPVQAPGADPASAGLQASPPARQLIAWVKSTQDSAGQPFIVIDKPQARAFAFDAQGRLRGTAPVLMGLARGDLSVPGIGERPLSAIRPEERTTPAGRFEAQHGRNAQGEDIVWVDYEAAVSLHRVRATNPSERRLQRLATPTPLDNRISYGCINVPVAFYERVVLPLLRPANGQAVVYVLPDELPLATVFPRLAKRPDGPALAAY